MRTCEPVRPALQSASQNRQPYLARSGPSLADRQFLPLSADTSTLLIADSPAHAAPCIFTAPGTSVCPSTGLTMSDFGRSEWTGVISAGSTAAPGATVRTGYR